MMPTPKKVGASQNEILESALGQLWAILHHQEPQVLSTLEIPDY
jgi:hypothetical protein